MSNKSSPIERARYPVFLFTVGSFAVAGLGILLKLLTESNEHSLEEILKNTKIKTYK